MDYPRLHQIGHLQSGLSICRFPGHSSQEEARSKYVSCWGNIQLGGSPDFTMLARRSSSMCFISHSPPLSFSWSIVVENSTSLCNLFLLHLQIFLGLWGLLTFNVLTIDFRHKAEKVGESAQEGAGLSFGCRWSYWCHMTLCVGAIPVHRCHDSLDYSFISLHKRWPAVLCAHEPTCSSPSPTA